jgi:hypothetical protein
MGECHLCTLMGLALCVVWVCVYNLAVGSADTVLKKWMVAEQSGDS